MIWELKDFSGEKKGYLQLNCDGERVCDFFPYAAGADPVWVRARAAYICDVLNGGIAAETSRCVEVAKSMGNDHIAAAIEMGALMVPTRA